MNSTRMLKYVSFCAIVTASLFFANMASARDLSTSCVPLRTISVKPLVEMVVEYSNQCGECIRVDVNWSYNGQMRGLPGFVPGDMQPGDARRMYIPLNLGQGDYQAHVIRVVTCH